MRNWAESHEISTKSIDILIEEGFNSMRTVALINAEDVCITKITRGQQKLILQSVSRLSFGPDTTGTKGVTYPVPLLPSPELIVPVWSCIALMHCVLQLMAVLECPTLPH
jgi:hypothetical protein